MATKGRSLALLTGVALVVVVAGVGWVNREELRTWYLLWRDFESLGVNAQGYLEYRHRKTGIIFVRLPGGEFWMGAQSEDPNGRNYYPEAEEIEGPVHRVILSPFLIAKFELSQAEWERVMGDNPSRFERGTIPVIGSNPSFSLVETLPVEQVSWEDCQEFCRKTGLSLPSEALWEYACRAGTTGPYAGTGNLDEMGWYRENSGGKTHPVGEKQPNEFGLYDMHGNVWEWCEDVADSEFYGKPAASQKNPVSTSGSEYRVIRGGGWHGSARHCRSASRVGYVPSGRVSNVGFRPAGSSLP